MHGKGTTIIEFHNFPTKKKNFYESHFGFNKIEKAYKPLLRNIVNTSQSKFSYRII